MSNSLLAWLRLARVPSIGPVLTKRLLEALGSPEAILGAHQGVLAGVEGIGTVRANQIVGAAAGTEGWAAGELARVEAAGISVVTQVDSRYPPALLTIADPPLLLYVRGELRAEDALAVGIVGARQCSLYGREQAARFGHDLARAGMTVISGGARGIDTAGHEGALRAGGRTIVVQGCGLMHTYPPENEGLYRRIVESGGAVISELAMESPPTKENFPPRNRIIAGMSLGVLVVEANLRSGSLITARLAAADYGREVFALPGRVDSPASAGTHHLIKSGSAHLVESVEDILDHLGEVGEALRRGMGEDARGAGVEKMGGVDVEARCPRCLRQRALIQVGNSCVFCSSQTGSEGAVGSAVVEVVPEVAFTSVQRRILEGISGEGSSVDDLLEVTGMAASVLMAELTMLQIRGAIRRVGGNRFCRR